MMKGIRFILISLIVFAALFLCAATIPKLLGRMAEARMESRFTRDRAAYVDIIPLWRTVYPVMSPCGGTADTNMAQVAKFFMNPDGTYEVTVQGDLQSSRSLADAARLLGIPASSLETLISKLNMAGMRGILQYEGRITMVRNPGDATGILYVPGSCPETSLLENVSAEEKSTQDFILLKALGDGWFYFVDQR